jgi:hypothetical protein
VDVDQWIFHQQGSPWIKFSPVNWAPRARKGRMESWRLANAGGPDVMPFPPPLPGFPTIVEHQVLFYGTVLYNTILYYTMLYNTLLYNTVSYKTVLYYIVLSCHIILCRRISCRYYIVLSCHIILYRRLSCWYYILLYNIVL